jgi:TonB family protein
MSYHFFFQTDFLSRRALAFAAIAAFHILIAYLLLTALVQAPAQTTDKLTVRFVTPTAIAEPPPQVPDFRPSNNHGPIVAPNPEPVASPREPSALASVAADQGPTGSGAGLPDALPIRMIGTNQLPNTGEYYPPDMRRQNIQGATNVRVCVDAQGRPVGVPMVEQSSGYAALDVGAVNVARHGRYARSLQGDVPVGNCFRFRIAFKIPR